MADDRTHAVPAPHPHDDGGLPAAPTAASTAAPGAAPARRVDVLMLVSGVLTLAVAILVLTGLAPALAPQWLFVVGAVGLGVVLLASGTRQRSGRRRRP